MPDADKIMGEHEKISKEELIILLRRQKFDFDPKSAHNIRVFKFYKSLDFAEELCSHNGGF